jgi:hypothetical protein
MYVRREAVLSSIINVNAARDHLGVSYVAANGMIKDLCGLGALSEVTGGSRNRVFRFGPCIDLFAEVAEEPPPPVGPSLAHQEAKMITENKTGTQPQQLGAWSCAEARGFEPRMGANPNRISSAAP